MTPRLVRIGRDATVVSERPEGLELESPLRLAPGRVVTIVRDEGPGSVERRRAVVWCWRVDRLGSAGATYRGACRWLALPREPATR